MASKIPESVAIIPVFDRNLSVWPFQVNVIAADSVQALKEPRGTKAGSAHLVCDTLWSFMDANFSKFFNEFLIPHVSQAELAA